MKGCGSRSSTYPMTEICKFQCHAVIMHVEWYCHHILYFSNIYKLNYLKCFSVVLFLKFLKTLFLIFAFSFCIQTKISIWQSILGWAAAPAPLRKSFCSEYFFLWMWMTWWWGKVSTRLVHNICLGRRTEESCNAIGVWTAYAETQFFGCSGLWFYCQRHWFTNSEYV